MVILDLEVVGSGRKRCVSRQAALTVILIEPRTQILNKCQDAHIPTNGVARLNNQVSVGESCG